MRILWLLLALSWPLPARAAEPQAGFAALWLAPTASYWLPGLDQWRYGAYGEAGAYGAVALAGHAWELDQRPKLTPDSSPLRDATGRRVNGALNLWHAAGGFSAYRSFRYEVADDPRFADLPPANEPGGLLLAPWRFDRYATRWTTLLAVAGAAAMQGLYRALPPARGYEKLSPRTITGADAGMAVALSASAGANEEAVFRGYLFPALRAETGSALAANLIQGGLFAAAHLRSTPLPLPQLTLGLFEGFVVERDGWRLGEAVFIHAWYDIITLLGSSLYRKKPAAVWLPAVNITI
jgi:membrane protease YdiL (CAAX protease family)